jgi:hypothetical protein
MIVKQGDNTGPPYKILDRRDIYINLFRSKKSEKENPCIRLGLPQRGSPSNGFIGVAAVD